MTPLEILQNAIRYRVFNYVHRAALILIFTEALLSVYKGFAAVIFLKKFLGERSGAKRQRAGTVIFSLMYSAVLIVEYILGGRFENIKLLAASIPLMVILSAYACIFCGGKAISKLAVSLAANAVMISVTLFSNLMSVELKGRMYERDFGVRGIYQIWTVVCISPFLIYFIMYIILWVFKKTEFSGKRTLLRWTLLSAALTMSIISALSVFIYFSFDKINRVRMGIFAGEILLEFVLFDIFVFILISDIIKKNRSVNELNLLRKTEEYNRQYIENLKNEYDAVRKLRHDCKNSLYVLLALLDEGETERAKKEIEKTLGELAEKEIFINTDNAIVNAVANAKLSQAKSHGIECECFVDKNVSGTDGSDLCRLLSNMLDNAVTACKNDPSPSRRIEFSIKREGEGYIYTVRNTVPESVLDKNPGLKSTKESPSEHGCGVGIIKEIAEKHGGFSDFYEENGMFCCSVHLLADNN